MNEIELTKAHKRLANITAESPNRFPLDHVHIKDGIAEVSDGFMLVQKPIDYKDELLLDAETIKKQKAYPVWCDVQADKVVAKDGSLTIESVSAIYPDTQSLYPQNGVKTKVTLNKNKLLGFLKCFNEEDALVEISIYGDVKPVQFEIKNLDDKFYGRGLIMPIIKTEGGK